MLIRITSLQSPELRDFTALTDVRLRKSLEAQEGLYIAESQKVIDRAIQSGHRPRAFLVLERLVPHMTDVIQRFPDTPVYVGSEAQLEQLTGFHLHRGALASMYRPPARDPRQILENAKQIVVLEGLSDHTNVGAIFRSVAALGADAVLLTPDCADPLYRRAIRVSMGAVLQIPWARLPDWKMAGPLLREAGFELVAFGFGEDAELFENFLDSVPERLALMFGSEGPGLSRRAIASSTRLVTIPMRNDVDSLNVATTAAIALWSVRHAMDRRRT